MDHQRKGMLKGLLAAVTFGLSAPLISTLTSTGSPIALAGLLYGGSALALLMAKVVLGKRDQESSVKRQDRGTAEGQTDLRWVPVSGYLHMLRVVQVRHQTRSERELSKALCMGGVFAISTVIPGKMQHLALHLGTLKHFAPDEALEHSLQVVGCFLVLSVLIWASKSEPQPVRPLLAYPPHNRDTVLVHVAGLAVGAVLMLV